MNGPDKLSILLVDDDDVDRELFHRLLGDTAFITEADSRARALEVYDADAPDCVLLDYRLPDVDGLDLLHALLEREATVILMTGCGNEAIAVDAMKAGASDYLIKSGATRQRVFQAIENAVERTRLRREVALQALQREELLKQLQETLDQVRTLSGLIPICAVCKNVRDDDGYWTKVEEYVSNRSGAHFSHGLCPDCTRRAYYDAGMEPPEELREHS